MGKQRPQERHVGPDPEDGGAGERRVQPGERRRPVRPPGDHFGEHGVVVRSHPYAFGQAGVDADAVACRFVQRHDGAAGGQEALGGVLGVDAPLDRVPGQAHTVLDDRQRPAGGDPELLGDQVDPGDHLGDRVLDL